MNAEFQVLLPDTPGLLPSYPVPIIIVKYNIIYPGLYTKQR